MKKLINKIKCFIGKHDFEILRGSIYGRCTHCGIVKEII